MPKDDAKSEQKQQRKASSSSVTIVSNLGVPLEPKRKTSGASSNSNVSEKKGELSPMLRRASVTSTSAPIVGVIYDGCFTDHRFIEVQSESGVYIIGGNCLSDQHLYNLFLKVTGSDELIAELQEAGTDTNNPYLKHNKLHHFFVELAKFLYVECSDGTKLTIDPEKLKRFTENLKQQDSLLVKSGKSEESIAAARREMVAILLGEKHKSDFALTWQRCWELIFHIEDKNEGVLRWEHRKKNLLDNKPLVAKLLRADLLCLQEVTKPDDFLSLCNGEGDAKHKNMGALVHKIHEHTTDHCVILYNADKYKVVDQKNYTLNKNKPCIFAKMKNIETGEYFILASIHYPGGEHQLFEEIMQQVNLLRREKGEITDIPYYVIGDMNHTSEFFDGHTPTGSRLCFPEGSTMGGPDFDNRNKSIDGILVNDGKEKKLTINVVKETTSVKPARAELKIEFVKPQGRARKESTASARGAISLKA